MMRHWHFRGCCAMGGGLWSS